MSKHLITELNEKVYRFISLGLNAHIPQHFKNKHFNGFLTRVALYSK